MSKKKTHRPHGHYCKICGEYKANENFSGKGRAAHICKACSRLPAAEKTAAITINRLMNLPAAIKPGWKTGFATNARKLRSWHVKYTICTFLMQNETPERNSLLSILSFLKFM